MGADDKARKNGALYNGLHFPTMKPLDAKNPEETTAPADGK